MQPVFGRVFSGCFLLLVFCSSRLLVWVFPRVIVRTAACCCVCVSGMELKQADTLSDLPLRLMKVLNEVL